MGKNIRYIYERAFYGCGLLTVDIPASVTSIGESVFENCKALTEINVSADNLNYSSQDGVLFDKSKNTLVCCPAGRHGAYIVPDCVATISKKAFADAKLTDVVISENVVEIEEYAFDSCSQLVRVNIPDGITNIGRATFAGCSNLKSLIIPSSVKNIENYILDGCDMFTDVYFKGTTEEWKNIVIGEYNDELKNANIHFNYSEKVEITSISVSANGEIEVEVKNVINDTVIIALYTADNRLLQMETITLEDGIGKSSSLSLKNAKMAKVFVWRSLGVIEPLCDSRSFNNDTVAGWLIAEAIGVKADVDVSQVSFSEEPEKENPGSAAFDGDFSTEWASRGGAYATVDLGENKTVTCVGIQFRRYSDDRTIPYYIYVSKDGIVWTEVYYGQSVKLSREPIYIGINENIRFVKYQFMGNNISGWSSVSEMEVYASE